MLKLIQSFTRYRQILPVQRINCSQVNSSFSTAQEPVNEQKILEKLRGRFPSASSIHVEDTSGGCGAMFNVSIETSDFKGLSIPKQHKIVYDALKEEISKIHGIHLQTRVSD